MLVHSSGGGRGRSGRGPGGDLPGSGRGPGGGHALEQVLQGARTSGALTLSGRGLAEVPPGVWELAEPPEAPQSADFNADSRWWEVCDLTKLVLSRNALASVAPDISRLEHLVLVDLSYNALASLPDSLGELQALKSLDVSHNQLEFLPAGIEAAPALAQLKCGSNRLRELPGGLGARGSLEVLEAGDNHLQHLPEKLASCPRLTSLDVQGNRLSQPPPCLSALEAAAELCLSRNRLEIRLLPDLSRLDRLTRLEVKEMGLASLPESLGACRSLVEIHAGFNELTGVPASLTSLAKLRVLDLRNNRVAAFPAALCGLGLSLLDLANNDLTGLPPELGNMTSLRKVVLEGNPLKSIRPAVASGPTPALLRMLRDRIDDGSAPVGSEPQVVARSGNVFGEDEAAAAAAAVRHVGGGVGGGRLSLRGAGLDEVPPEVWDAAPALSELRLDDNRLHAIDARLLAACARLVALSAVGNQLSAWPLPPGAGSMASLTELDLSGNPGLCPAQGPPLAACPFLRSLSLARCPDAAAAVAGGGGGVPLCDAAPALEELRLSSCRLARLPLGVGGLEQLRVLDLSGNRIHEVPAGEVVGLERLEELDLSNNDVAGLPPELGTLPRLRALGLEGNPLRGLRRQIIERGTPAVLEYLRFKLPDPGGAAWS